MKKLRWYVAVLVMQSEITTDPPTDPLVDLEYRLVRAPGDEEAYDSAIALGRSAELSYENPDGETVNWVFKGLHDLQEIFDSELGHGTEVYYWLEFRPAEDFVTEKSRLTLFSAEAIRHLKARDVFGK
jgi:hypothetical protein